MLHTKRVKGQMSKIHKTIRITKSYNISHWPRKCIVDSNLYNLLPPFINPTYINVQSIIYHVEIVNPHPLIGGWNIPLVFKA